MVNENTNEILEHISEKSWGDYTAADYSVDQWHFACIIHQHDGVPTSKSLCKLPVKTPSGALNRNGVHAAALAGARGGVDASPENIASAKKAVARLYAQLDEEPPTSIKQATDMGKDFVEHYGVKGQQWGVRRSRRSRAAAAKRTVKSAKNMSDEELRTVINRMNLEKQYNSLTGQRSTTSAGAAFAKSLAGNIARQQLTNVVNAQIAKALSARTANRSSG